jgi:hypothetical protein
MMFDSLSMMEKPSTTKRPIPPSCGMRMGRSRTCDVALASWATPRSGHHRQPAPPTVAPEQNQTLPRPRRRWYLSRSTSCPSSQRRMSFRRRSRTPISSSSPSGMAWYCSCDGWPSSKEVPNAATDATPGTYPSVLASTRTATRMGQCGVGVVAASGSSGSGRACSGASYDPLPPIPLESAGDRRPDRGEQRR